MVSWRRAFVARCAVKASGSENLPVNEKVPSVSATWWRKVAPTSFHLRDNVDDVVRHLFS
jgi:hypothetical protein